MNMIMQLQQLMNTGILDAPAATYQALDITSYLGQESRITSLIKAKDTSKHFNEIPILELGYRGYANAKNKPMYLRKRIASKLIQPLLEKRDFEKIRSLFSFCDLEVQIIPATGQAKEMMEKQFGSNCEPVQLIIYHNTGKRGMLAYEEDLYACLNHDIPAKYDWRFFKSNRSIQFVNLALFIANLVMYSEVIRYFKSTEIEKNQLYSSIEKTVSTYNYEQVCYYTGWYTSYLTILTEVESKLGFRRKSLPTVRHFKYDRDYQFLDPQAIFNLLVYETKQIPCPVSFFMSQNKKMPLYSDVVDALFIQLLEEYQADKSTAEYVKKLTNGCATAYMTKKNIPEYILKAMSESKFNNYFGFVEYDQDVDLDKMKQIEDEFISLNEFFRINDLKDYALRFRYLGKHRARGVYFPTENCMCVDLDAPDSFAHEFFHLLDFKHEEVSRRIIFNEIRDKYKAAVRAEIKRIGKEDELENTGSKYNLAYFFEPTEIFARCGEMYLQQKGIDNSLAKTDASFNFAYPIGDSSLMECVISFYDALIPTMQNN